MKKTIILMPACVQVSPDDFRLTTKSLEVSDNTTIGDIKKWVEKINKRGLPLLTITETENDEAV